MIRQPIIHSITHDILGDPFWTIYNRGVAAAAEGSGCIVHSFRPERYSPEQMCKVIEGSISERPDGMLCTIPDASVLDASLRKAIAAGIAVVAANARDPRDGSTRIPYLLYIGGDDRNGGRLAGQRLVKEGKAKNVVCFDHYLIEQSCHADRFAGLQDVISTVEGAACRRVNIWGDSPDAASDAVRDSLRDDSAIDAIVTLGPPGARAVFRGMSGTRSNTAHITFDFSDEQLSGLREGQLLAIIDSQQYIQGYLGVHTLALYLRFGLLPTSDILTGPALVDAGNLEAAALAYQTGAR
jgi:simple sugar transport system substrate-binding protein